MKKIISRKIFEFNKHKNYVIISKYLIGPSIIYVQIQPGM